MLDQEVRPEIHRLPLDLAASTWQLSLAIGVYPRAHPDRSERAIPECFCPRARRPKRDYKWCPRSRNAAGRDSWPPTVANETDCLDRDRLRVAVLGLIVASGPAGGRSIRQG